MSATVAAALKKAVVALLTDPKVRKTIVGIILGIIIIIVMPIIAVVSIFNGDIQIDQTVARDGCAKFVCGRNSKAPVSRKYHVRH